MSNPKMPLWLPVPGWPYYVTSRGAMGVRSATRLDNRGRRVGGRRLALQNFAQQVNLRRVSAAGFTEVRCRGLNALRGEAIDAWEAAEAEEAIKAKAKRAK